MGPHPPSRTVLAHTLDTPSLPLAIVKCCSTSIVYRLQVRAAVTDSCQATAVEHGRRWCGQRGAAGAEPETARAASSGRGFPGGAVAASSGAAHRDDSSNGSPTPGREAGVLFLSPRRRPGCGAAGPPEEGQQCPARLDQVRVRRRPQINPQPDGDVTLTPGPCPDADGEREPWRWERAAAAAAVSSPVAATDLRNPRAAADAAAIERLPGSARPRPHAGAPTRPQLRLASEPEPGWPDLQGLFLPSAPPAPGAPRRPAGREALHEALILLTTRYYVERGLPLKN
jgi:hypothetical protein